MAEPVYRLTMAGQEFIVTPRNSYLKRFYPSNLIDHLEVHTEDAVYGGYASPDLLEELEKEGWYTETGPLTEAEIVGALGWFAVEITQACDYDMW